MENKITKNLIILGAIIFSFAMANSVFADTTSSNQGYSQYSYYQQSGYNPNNQYNNSYYNPNTQYNNNSYYNPYNSNQGYLQYGYNPQPVYNPVNPYNQVYPQYGYFQSSAYSVNNSVPNNTTTKAEPSVVNNYYQTAPATVAKTSTTTVDKTTTDTSNKNTTASDTNGVYSNNLGTSAYNGNGITALSLRGSGGFMPSSIWQWILVVILILVIVVISRIFINKRTVVQESHTTSHTH